MQDTGDTRETPAIDVCKGLIADNAKINIYDPKVTEIQIHNDLSLGKFMWDHPASNGTKSPRQDAVSVFKDAYSVGLPFQFPSIAARLSSRGSIAALACSCEVWSQTLVSYTIAFLSWSTCGEGSTTRGLMRVLLHRLAKTRTALLC
jgi:hypothetical protein